MKKSLFKIVLLLSVSLNIYSQKPVWTSNELDMVELSFTGYDTFKMKDEYSARGTKNFGQYYMVTDIFHLGSTPTQRQSLYFSTSERSTDVYNSIMVLYGKLKSNVKGYVGGLNQFSGALNFVKIVEGFKYFIGDCLTEVGIVNQKGSYYIVERQFNGENSQRLGDIQYYDREKGKNWTFSRRAELYYTTIKPQDLNPFNLKEYSNFFGTDLLVFHDHNVGANVFGWLGDGYMKFKPLEEGVLGIANGMNDNYVTNISIDPDEWSKASKWKRLWVVYHEIAHDIYNVKHGEGGELMDATVPNEVSFLDFYFAKSELLEFIKSRSPKKYKLKTSS